MHVDLHTHTTASDGYLEPTALLETARAAGLQVLGLTDHDTVDGLRDVQSHATRLGLMLVPGIEISAYWRRVEFHILGYWVDPGDAQLTAFLRQTRGARLDRLRAMIGRLWRMGIGVSADEVLAQARDGNVGRPHLARILVRHGVVASTDEAFDRYLGTDRPAFVPRPDVTAAQAIAIIRAAGGLASLAHPGLHERDEAIPELVAAGLDALEVYHPNHLPPKLRRYRRLAARHRLLVTGGSDFHGGPNGEHGSGLGTLRLPEPDFRALLTAAEARRPALRGAGLDCGTP